MMASAARERAAFFQAAGYLRLPGLLPLEQVDRMRAVACGIGPEAGGGPARWSAERTRVDSVVSYDPVFWEAATFPALLDAAELVLGANVELVENRHNHVSVYRAPGSDRLHRDILQWSRSLLTVLVYMSDCTRVEAATRVVPGSHLWPCGGAPNNGGTWLDESPYAQLTEQAVPLPARSGDAVLMNGQLYHAGAGASADGPRVVLTLAFRSVDELAEGEPARCRLVRGQRIYRGRGAVRV